jgi:hypothetical protein
MTFDKKEYFKNTTKIIKHKYNRKTMSFHLKKNKKRKNILNNTTKNI